MNPAAGTAQPQHKTLLLIVANLISIASLIWVLHDLDFAKMIAELRSMHWGWVALGIASDIAVYFVQAWRWNLVLAPIQSVGFWRSVRAIYVGLYANEILPMRTGEIIRCYLLGRWNQIRFSVVLSSALLERIFDGIWLIACLLVTSYLVRLPDYLVRGGWALAAVVAVCGILLVAAMFHPQRVDAVFERNRWLKKLLPVMTGLHAVGHSRYLHLALLASLPYLLMQVVPIFAFAQAYNIELGIVDALVVMVYLRLGAVVPQAPGNLGLFQFLAIVALTTLGFDKGLAQRFSIMLWSFVTLPLLIAGFVALTITGLKITQLRREAEASAGQPTVPAPSGD